MCRDMRLEVAPDVNKKMLIQEFFEKNRGNSEHFLNK